MIEALRRYCDAHDLEMVGEFEDRASGVSLDRLGLDALRDAVSAGGVDAVLAQDRDRFSREPAHVYILREEFRELGATLRSLNDRGDDSPEGELTDGILDQLAKFERAKTVERTRRGRTTIRNIILSDTYLGTFWWGKEKRTATTVSVVENGVRTYRKKVKREERPREEWAAIPVPDSGIPPETVALARENIKGNAWNPSRNSNRIWELYGGTGLRGYCGSCLKTHTSSNAAKTKYFYYMCPKRTSNRDNGTCPNTKHYRAELLELLVRDTLVDTFREESWIDFVNDTCDRRVDDLRKAHHSDPSKTRERLCKQIDALETKITRVKDLYVDGDISKEEYRERKTVLEGDIAQVTDELSKLDDLDGEMKRIEHLRAALLSVESPFSRHYASTGNADLDTIVEHDLSYGSRSTAARRRMELYRGVGLRVTVGQDMEISLAIAEVPVSENDRVPGSTRSPTETP